MTMLVLSPLAGQGLSASETYRTDNGAVTAGPARFEFVTPTMVRIEFSPTSHFVDQPTVVVQLRRKAAIPVSVKEENGWVVVSSTSLTLRYKAGSGAFTKENLSVAWNFANRSGTWSPGDPDTLNLGGITTLDGVNGDRLPPPQKGILSRSGYFVLDDSGSPVMDSASAWVAARTEDGDQDWYFLAYGSDYRHALKDFSLLCGQIPMVPRYSLGIWMTDLNYEYLAGSDMTTKFHFTSDDLKKEIDRFRSEGLPLDVLVLDFGWHKFGWQGGYDWSPVFDNARDFLSWCHGAGLHVTVNDHPKTRGETALADQDSHASGARRLLGENAGGKPAFTYEFPEKWRFNIDPTDTGRLASWGSPNFNDSSWGYLDGGKTWQEQGYPNYIGAAWYRKWVELPPNNAKRLYLIFGGASSQYALFVNGKMVSDHISAGNSTYNTMTYTEITDSFQKGKPNLIALRINAWSNYGGLSALPVEISDAVPPGMLEFTLTDKRQAGAFMNALHAPPMKEGIDFWWIDGTGPCLVKGLNDQLWTNKLYYDFTQELTGKRSLILSRYAGWGSQRYPAFHTGDTYSEWPMLAFQVGFSARGGNMLIPYVSNDIGGFHADTLGVGLYCRWLEFGAFSPVMRLHGAYENPANGNLRMPWMYGQTGIDVAQRYFNLREQLLPYIYTYARAAHDDGLPLMRPLYLEYPEAPEAYLHPDEYFFGDNFLVSPVVDSNNIAATYLPPGKWIRYSDGREIEGGVVVKRSYDVNELPLFVKSGSVIPMQKEMRYGDERPLDTLIVQVFGPDSGHFNLYEDDGLSLQYLQGRYSWTPISSSGKEGDGYRIIVGAASGSYDRQPARRAYIFRLHGFPEPNDVIVDGHALRNKAKTEMWHRDVRTGDIEITVPPKDIRKKFEVVLR